MVDFDYMLDIGVGRKHSDCMRKSLKSIFAIMSVTTSLVAFSPAEAEAFSPSVSAASSAEYSQNVANVQTVLSELGYYQSAITGMMDNVTRLAVKTFQASNGIAASGVVDPATSDKLNEIYNSGGDASSKPVGYSDNIESIQQILKQLGYYDYAPDGVANVLTRSAIRKFQTDAGLPQTGRTDSKTAAAMNVAYDKSVSGRK